MSYPTSWHDSGKHRQTQILIPYICVPSCDDLFVDSRLIAFLLCGFQHRHDDVEGIAKAQNSIPNICVLPYDVSEKTPTWLCFGDQVSNIIGMISRKDINSNQLWTKPRCFLEDSLLLRFVDTVSRVIGMITRKDIAKTQKRAEQMEDKVMLERQDSDGSSYFNDRTNKDILFSLP